MAYDTRLAERVRKYLKQIPALSVEEKRMFRGLTFMVNGKMCISVSGENLMCRFDPAMQEEVALKKGFQTMIMKGKVYRGYGYISPAGFHSKSDFEYWANLCLTYNETAQSSKKRK